MPHEADVDCRLMAAHRRIALEAAISAVVAFLGSLIVFGPILGHLDSAWAGGDMLSTYVNSVDWGGFAYRLTTEFGFPLGMNLNYFPGIDITENSFALVVNTVTGSTFLGINLLVVLSFPLVAALAYLTIRMTGLQGPLAIALAVTFAFIPFHWGRALGHTYLSTLYSAVVGVALVLLIGSGAFERLLRNGDRRRRITMICAVAVMVITVAWTGVYYAVFTLILGGAALVWRFAQRASWRSLIVDTVPIASVGILSAVAFVPTVLTLRTDAPLASLGDRMPYESVTLAGNLAVALLPLPQSSLPGFDFYNRSVLEAIGAAGRGESTAITNHGTWVTTAALIVIVCGLIWHQRRPRLQQSASRTPVTLGFVSYLIVVTLLFFVPWGLNYLFAGTVSAQIRGWNRLVPILLLLFLIGAAVVLQRTRFAASLVISVPVALVILGLALIDSVFPFRQAYSVNVGHASTITAAAREYASSVNAAIPEDCGVLQLPYIAYPENGPLSGMTDYDHFWTAITNPGKQWSYGSVKYTDASIWASQLPQLPTDAQLDLLRATGFCAIHLDLRGFEEVERQSVIDNLTARLAAPAATGFDGNWLLFSLGAPTGSPDSTTPEVTAFLHEPFIVADPMTTTARESELAHAWWWTTAASSSFTLTPTAADAPLTMVTGRIGAPSCGPIPVTVTLQSGDQSLSTTLTADPGSAAKFALTLPTPTASAATLRVDAPNTGCIRPGDAAAQFAQVLDLTAR